MAADDGDDDWGRNNCEEIVRNNIDYAHGGE
jgi:hypothetical protein